MIGFSRSYALAVNTAKHGGLVTVLVAPSRHGSDPFPKKLYTESWSMEGNSELHPGVPGLS